MVYNPLSEMEWTTSFPLGLLLLGFCILTTTYVNYRQSLRWLRVVLAVPTGTLWLRTAFPPSPHSFVLPPSSHVQICVYSLYMLSRTLEVCIIGFWDGDHNVARWIVRKEKGGGGEEESPFTTLPLPTTLKGRVAYVVDNLLSLRGASLFKNHAWSWARRSIREYQAPEGRLNVLKVRVKDMVVHLGMFDLAEHVLCNEPWNLRTPTPLTSLSIPRQIWLTLAIVPMFYGGNDVTFIACDFFFGAFLGFPISPPLYDGGNPIASQSLADFWSNRWHAQFRRVFDRSSLPVVWALTRRDGTLRVSRVTLNFFRCFVIFSISTLLHLAIGHAIPPAAHIIRPFWDVGMMKFFFLQPFGLLFEVLIVRPVAEGAVPEEWRLVVTRTYFWCWMVWTGRWCVDGYALTGLLDKKNVGVLSDSLVWAWGALQL